MLPSKSHIRKTIPGHGVDTAVSHSALVYLDHILYPTITASGFTTEVFHVNGKGEEAGVVMSEMQGVEQNPTTVLARK